MLQDSCRDGGRGNASVIEHERRRCGFVTTDCQQQVLVGRLVLPAGSGNFKRGDHRLSQAWRKSAPHGRRFYPLSLGQRSWHYGSNLNTTLTRMDDAFILEFDGGARGNPGPAGTGSVV